MNKRLTEEQCVRILRGKTLSFNFLSGFFGRPTESDCTITHVSRTDICCTITCQQGWSFVIDSPMEISYFRSFFLFRVSHYLKVKSPRINLISQETGEVRHCEKNGYIEFFN